MSDQNDADDHKLVIQQIVPTAGPWLSIFDDGTVRPVACWGLIACVSHGDSYVAPMVPVDGEIIDATQLEGYRDSLPEMDEEDLENYVASLDDEEFDDGDDYEGPDGETTH